jgi:hypothetical protein
MMFDEALVAMMNGASVRRDAWWPSKVRAAAVLNDGFNEPMLYHRKNDALVPYPLALDRAGWFAGDWMIVDQNGMVPSDQRPRDDDPNDPGPVPL